MYDACSNECQSLNVDKILLENATGNVSHSFSILSVLI